jgi:N-acetylneuraminic acid mutarotase
MKMMWRRSLAAVTALLVIPACNESTFPGGARNFRRSSAAGLALSTHSLSFTASASGAAPAAQIVQISNPTGSDVLHWAIRTDQTWLRGTPGAGALSGGSVSVSVSVVATQAEAWGGATATLNAPSGQEDGSAVWTGTEMIVWGGHGPIGTMVQTGARYDPSADTWTGATSTAGAPSSRWGHSAVWSGTEMIVWGGAPGGSPPLDDGYRYNPATDTWSTAISTVGAPSPRRVHAAVWTGTEMIIWGGLTAGGATDTGARYNPRTDTWSPISMVGAPTARDYVSAVWTGTDVIVFGGTDNTGKHYDPATDTWGASLSAAGAPVRNNPCVSWTGSEMIVWSGWDGSTQPDTGARYDLVADSWQAMTTVNAPIGRRSGVAVWTGGEMIIWGGYDGGGFNSVGRRYLPPIGLTPGVHTGTLTVSSPEASNSPQTVVVTLTVTP